VDCGAPDQIDLAVVRPDHHRVEEDGWLLDALSDVEADPGSLAKAGDDVKLLAGMPAEVYIKGEERTPLMYLVEPVTQVLRRAGRER